MYDIIGFAKDVYKHIKKHIYIHVYITYNITIIKKETLRTFPLGKTFGGYDLTSKC